MTCTVCFGLGCEQCRPRVKCQVCSGTGRAPGIRVRPRDAGIAQPPCLACQGAGSNPLVSLDDPTEDEIALHVAETERDLLREQLDAALLDLNHHRELVAGLVLFIATKGGAS